MKNIEEEMYRIRKKYNLRNCIYAVYNDGISFMASVESVIPAHIDMASDTYFSEDMLEPGMKINGIVIITS